MTSSHIDSSPRPKVLSAALGIFSICILAQIFFNSPKGLLRSTAELVDLGGEWDYCIPQTESKPEELPWAWTCSWEKIAVPSSLPVSRLKKTSGWALYRTSFSTPRFCHEGDTLCALLIGEIGDAAEVRLNGETIGRHGGFPPRSTYAKHYPARFDLPPAFLRTPGAMNELLVLVRYMKREQAGLRRDPIAILPTESAQGAVKSITAQSIIIPLVSSLGVAIIAALSFLSLVFSRIRDQKLIAFTRYGAIAALFLASLSSLPREVLPLPLSGCLHFLLRFAMDWALLELLADVFQWKTWVRRMARPFYSLILTLFVLQFALHFWAGVRSPYSGFDGAVLLSRIADFPFVVGPYLYGLLSAWVRRSLGGRTIAGIFALLFGTQLSDALAFHQVHTLPYFSSFYPFFAALSLGLFLWGAYFLQRQQLEAEAKLAELGRQVAHDMKSPISALDKMISSLAEIPEGKRKVIRSALSRINYISNLLNEQSKRLLNGETSGAMTVDSGDSQSPGVHHVSSLIEPLISEKRFQYRPRMGVEIEADFGPESYDLFVRLVPTELKRVLSNLIDNAVEAIEGEGWVHVVLERTERTVTIEVSDTGVGIPKDILSALGTRGFSFGKPRGSGLGLYSARRFAEENGGSLSIESQQGHGARVKLELAMSPPPKWFVSSLCIQPEQDIVIMDDERSVHTIWERRFAQAGAEAGLQLSVIHHAGSHELGRWIASYPGRASRATYLMDYELIHERSNGLEIVEELGLANRAILVTSHAEEARVIGECERLGVRLIPKSLAAFVPVDIVLQGRKGPTSTGEGSFVGLKIGDGTHSIEEAELP